MTKQKMPPAALWTKNFTIITAGTVVSVLGSAVAGFALGLLVLDYTGSTFLYALYMVMYNLPKIAAPTLAGPFIDKFSRKKTIYTLDFISAALYGGFAWLIVSGHFQYFYLISGCLLLGTIDSVYQVTYDSFYPMLVSEGNYTKAYSIQSTLESLAMFIIPVSAFLYHTIGIAPLFALNMASFLIAALLETQIRIEEAYVKREDEFFGFAQYRKTFLEGIGYLKRERGLFAVTIYFMISFASSGAFSTIVLPYFRLNFNDGDYVYLFTMGWMVAGRLLGGAVHYRLRYPTDKKYVIALSVYIITSIIDGVVLYLPLRLMMFLCFTEGFLGVTSYNIRVSATQSYVPDERKGRFNGIFQMATTIGLLSGEFFSGVFTLIFPERAVLTGFMALSALGAIVIMGGNKKEVEKVYNRQA